MPLAKSTSRQRPALRLALKRHPVGKDRTLAGPGCVSVVREMCRGVVIT